MNGDAKSAHDELSEDAEWLQSLLGSLISKHGPEETKRFQLGRFTLDEASLLLALSRCETGAFEARVRDYMQAAVDRSDLRLRDEVTGLLVGDKHQANGWGVITRADVNAWLERNEVGFRWEDAPATPARASSQQGPADSAHSIEEAPCIGEAGPAVTSVSFGETDRAVGATEASSPALMTESGESTVARRMRRIARLKVLGGSYRRHGDSWMATGRRGATADLQREEDAAGRPVSKPGDLRRDLIAAMEAETTGK